MTLTWWLFKAEFCLLNNFQMLTLGCIKLLLTCSHNSSPWSASLVIPKRSTHTLFSWAHVKPWYGRALYLPGTVATCWWSRVWCLLSTPSQELMILWNGAMNSCVLPHPGFPFLWCLWDSCWYHEWNQASWAGLSIGTAGWPKEGLEWSFPKGVSAPEVAFQHSKIHFPS